TSSDGSTANLQALLNVTGAWTCQFENSDSGVSNIFPFSVSPVAVTPPSLPTVTSLIINPGSVNSGASATVTIGLSSAAPSGGAAVSLTTNNSGFPLPSAFVIQAGRSSGSFAANASTVLTAATTTAVTATYNGTSR